MNAHCLVQPIKNPGTCFGFQTLGEGAMGGVAFLVNRATVPVCCWDGGEELAQPPFERVFRCDWKPSQSAIQNNVDESLEVILKLINVGLHPHRVKGPESGCPLGSHQR